MQIQTRFVRLVVLGGIVATVASACMVVPIGADGRPYAVAPIPPNPAVSSAGIAVPSGPATVTIGARLYPANETANVHGVLHGTVTNHLNGRGEFQLGYAGESLSGEATRTQDDARRGVANAYGTRGTSLACQYQMSTPTRGTGVCTMSNGGRYQLHIGG